MYKVKTVLIVIKHKVTKTQRRKGLLKYVEMIQHIFPGFSQKLFSFFAPLGLCVFAFNFIRIFLPILISSLFLFNVLHATEMPTLAFHHLAGLESHLEKDAAAQNLRKELSLFHQKTVKIKGFVLEKEGQRWLSAEPNLKSCCVGSGHKISQQILLQDIPVQLPLNTLVSIQGIFRVEPIWNSAGTLMQLYRIDKIEILHESLYPWKTFAFLGIILGGIFSICYLYRKQNQELGALSAKES